MTAAAYGSMLKLEPDVESNSEDLPRRQLGVLGVAVMAFAIVAGGPFSSEAAIGSAGFLPTVIGLSGLTIFWVIPQALIVAEMSATFPQNGGTIQWVMQGLGPLCGFANGCCQLIGTVISNAMIFSVLRGYSTQFKSHHSPAESNWFSVSEVIMVLIALVGNVIGIGTSIFALMVLSVCVQIPFVLMPVVAVAEGKAFHFDALVQSEGRGEHISVFISTLFYCLAGWTYVGNIAGEVKDVKSSFPLGLFIAVLLVLLNFVYPLIYGVALCPDTRLWQTGYLVRVAEIVSPFFAWCVMVAVVATNTVALLACSTSLANSLAAAAELGIVPCDLLSTRMTRFNTPVPAIAAAILLPTLLSIVQGRFTKLSQYHFIFTQLALCFQVAAFLRLKYVEPARIRPFCVPGGQIGAWASVLSIFICLLISVLAMLSEHQDMVLTLLLVLLLLYAGGFMWREVKCRAS